MRFLQANDYKTKPALKEIFQHLEWRKENLPIIINDMQKSLIDHGFLYTHGRDKLFRPLVIHNPRIFKTMKPDINEALIACHFVMQYIVEHMLIPGYIENWIPIIDLDNMSVNDIPKRRILSFINSNKMVFKCRAYKCYIFRSTTGLRWLYKLISPFLDTRARNKLVFVKGDRSEDLVDLFHPSQLEKQFGGEAENVECFWPPYEASHEYGEDQNMFTLEGEEDTVIDNEHSLIKIGKR